MILNKNRKKEEKGIRKGNDEKKMKKKMMAKS